MTLGSWEPTKGHHFELLAPLHICGTDAATKFKFCAQMHYGPLLPADQKLCRNAAGVTIPCEKFTPTCIGLMAIKMET